MLLTDSHNRISGHSVGGSVANGSIEARALCDGCMNVIMRFVWPCLALAVFLV